MIAANKVDASPTKRFFINVLVKDINLLDAIVELVDNSVDAARSKLGNKDSGSVVINLDFDATSFRIQDNSGGMTIEHAKNNAFRFGRPDDAPPTPGTVGEFGVGMKRALFKIGRHFIVESTTSNEFFEIEVDVDDWEVRKDDSPDQWTFEFKTQNFNVTSAGPFGTILTVTKLHAYASTELGSSSFESRLMESLRQAHAESLADGLQITINNKPVLGRHATLLESSGLRPIVKDIPLTVNSKPINIKLVAGVGDPKLVDAGWYIYCNGRLIERAEKSEKTGWNSTLEDSDKTPKAHWQFRRFRGYIYFESKHQDVLPWNTTKTSLNVEAPAYLRMLSEMKGALRQVLEFLNALDAESSQPGNLTALVDDAKPKRIADLAANTTFTVSATTSAPAIKDVRISYVRPSEIVNVVRQHLGVTSNRDVGEKTFNYYIQNEGLDG